MKGSLATLTFSLLLLSFEQINSNKEIVLKQDVSELPFEHSINSL